MVIMVTRNIYIKLDRLGLAHEHVISFRYSDAEINQVIQLVDHFDRNLDWGCTSTTSLQRAGKRCISYPNAAIITFSHIHTHEIHLENSHKLSHKRLQMKDDFGSRFDSMLVERRPLDHLSLQPIVYQSDKLKCQRLEDGSGWDAMCQKVV